MQIDLRIEFLRRSAAQYLSQCDADRLLREDDAGLVVLHCRWRHEDDRSLLHQSLQGVFSVAVPRGLVQSLHRGSRLLPGDIVNEKDPRIGKPIHWPCVLRLLRGEADERGLDARFRGACAQAVRGISPRETRKTRLAGYSFALFLTRLRQGLPESTYLRYRNGNGA
jgi:hypothetical protein